MKSWSKNRSNRPTGLIRSNGPTRSTRSAYQQALRYLTFKSYSSKGLRDKLNQLQVYDRQEVEQVIQTLIDQKYLDDKTYAYSRVSQWIQKGYSANFIKEKLSKEGLCFSLDFIEEIFQEKLVTEEDQIKGIIEKKLRTLTPKALDDFHNVESKIAYQLMRKGHRPSAGISLLKTLYQTLHLQLQHAKQYSNDNERPI